MILSEDAIKEYQHIYQRQYQIGLSREAAIEQGQRLLRVFKIIFRPLPKNIEMKKYETKQT